MHHFPANYQRATHAFRAAASESDKIASFGKTKETKCDEFLLFSRLVVTFPPVSEMLYGPISSVGRRQVTGRRHISQGVFFPSFRWTPPSFFFSKGGSKKKKKELPRDRKTDRKCHCVEKSAVHEPLRKPARCAESTLARGRKTNRLAPSISSERVSLSSRRP